VTGSSAVVVVAHADDETLGGGGTIAWLAGRGWTVDVVVVCDGQVPRDGAVDDNREAAHEACRVLGAGPPTFLGFVDQHLAVTPLPELTHAISVAAGVVRPALVLTHDSSDLNSDHRAVAEAAMVVWRPAHDAPAVLAMEIPGSTTWAGVAFGANYYVDVGATIDRKVEALTRYPNELRDAPHPRSEHGVRTTAAYHGLQSGFAYAEAFRVVRAVAGRLP
jgi:LmbE family N-acetylglucosaminyl deacetylase